MNLGAGIYISDNAKQQVTNLLEKDGKQDDHFLRISVVSGGCSG